MSIRRTINRLPASVARAWLAAAAMAMAGGPRIIVMSASVALLSGCLGLGAGAPPATEPVDGVLLESLGMLESLELIEQLEMLAIVAP